MLSSSQITWSPGDVSINRDVATHVVLSLGEPVVPGSFSVEVVTAKLRKGSVSL